MNNKAGYLLKDKNILIIGASSGIGRKTAMVVASEGARVSVVARRESLLKEWVDEMNGAGHRFYPFDLNDLDGIGDLIKQIVKEQGKLDGMAYFAGIGQHVPIKMSKPSYSQKVMNVNYFAFAEVIRQVSNLKNCNPGASMIGMSSLSGLQGDKGLMAYSASKGAMNSAIRCAAIELGEKNIRVNGIATGFIEGTDMYNSVNDRIGWEEVKKFAESKQVLGIGKPEYIADAAVFLLSEKSSYITGTILRVDGGYLG